jgi:hypothetical protein
MNIIIKPSTKPEKKFTAIIDNKKSIHFGQKNASDFTQHKNPTRKKLYENRHKKNEDWSNPLTAGFYAKNILWNKPTITESIKDTNKRFKNISINMR